MKSKFTIEIEIEHDGTSSNNEIAEALELHLKQNNSNNQPDDLGITKVVVVAILVNPMVNHTKKEK